MRLIAAIAPPIAKDTLLYHFAVPKAFIAQHSNAFIDGNIASYLALGTEMQSVWATLLGNIVSLGGRSRCGATNFSFLPAVVTRDLWMGDEIGHFKNVVVDRDSYGCGCSDCISRCVERIH